MLWVLARAGAPPSRAVRAGGEPSETHMTTQPAPQDKSEGAAALYAAVLRALDTAGAPYMVGGSHASGFYIGEDTPEHDLDVFCLAGDYPRLVRAGVEAGFEAEVEDERWIAKVRRGERFCDVIFGSANMMTPATLAWFGERHDAEMYGVPVRVLPPVELIWSKAFVMDRSRFDGNVAGAPGGSTSNMVASV